jgi:hypothetical protein
MRVRMNLSLIFTMALAGCEASTEPSAKPTAPAIEAKPPGATDHPPTVSEAGGKLRLDKLSFEVPEGWQTKPASSSFVLAEFVLPKAEGDDADGRLTVSAAGGSIEANIDRWRDQFGGKPERAS